MGSLMKECLKCICGENEWCYAVFWRTGYNNHRLLVWEECYYEPHKDLARSDISGFNSTKSHLQDPKGLWSSGTLQTKCQDEDRVLSLLNKMMVNNQVHVVGEGVVGRAAFTGCYRWILQENTIRQAYPLDIMEEAHHLFSAGMQTVAIIPVFSHGVVQLGSTHSIVENKRFVNDVKNLIAQLGGVPNSILLNNYAENDPSQLMKVAISPGVPLNADLEKYLSCDAARFTPFSRCNQVVSTGETSKLVRQSSHSSVTRPGKSMQSNGLVLKRIPNMLSTTILKSAAERRINETQVIISRSDPILNLPPSMPNSSHRHSLQLGSFHGNLNSLEQNMFSCDRMQDHGLDRLPVPIESSTHQLKSNLGGLLVSSIASSPGGSESFYSGKSLPTQYSIGSSAVPHKTAKSSSYLNGIPLSSDKCSMHASNNVISLNKGDALHMSLCGNHSSNSDSRLSNIHTAGKQVDFGTCGTVKIPQAHQYTHISNTYSPIRDCLQDGWPAESSGSGSQNVIMEDSFPGVPLGGELFDIFHPDYSRKQVSGSSIDPLIDGGDTLTIIDSDISSCTVQIDTVDPHSYAMNDGILEIGDFLESGGDNLLDAVVSKVQTFSNRHKDESFSCWTTLSNTSSSVLTGSLACTSNMEPYQRPEKQIGQLSSLKSQIVESSSTKSSCSKENARLYSQHNFLNGSHASLDEDPSETKADKIISTDHSMRLEATGKSNRKRLRPGETPRPRPKDRQNIQDRVKELREIVPNGTKCSIDALLEKTIKHMLFLQSVTKHADNLNQSVESKIISKEGELLLKDNFVGGVTWAFEVDSQSLGCPIIVEDLSKPRQMLVEMLCGQHGCFLEIADIVTGLGLTILKGVMEIRVDKVWVCFTVEANRDVTRMEIFMALVHLLEQTMKNHTAFSTEANIGNVIEHINVYQ